MNSKYKKGDIVTRKWNGQNYYINHLVGIDEYLISKEPNTKVSKCKICEHEENLTISTGDVKL